MFIRPSGPVFPARALFLFLCTITLLSHALPATPQAIKASVASAPLVPTPFPQWTQDLGYQQTQTFPLTLSSFGCQLVNADLSGISVQLMLDSGTASGFVITNTAPPIPHQVLQSEEQLNPDGSHRGESSVIRVESMSILGQEFQHVEGVLADWRMFSSEPFDGTVGLHFFLNRRVTLDYQSGRVAAASSGLPKRLDPKRYISIDLVDPPKGHILYVRAKVNGRDAIIYLDTGYNVSFISPAFAQSLPRVERTGKFKVFREAVPLELGGAKFVLDDLRESDFNRGPGFDLPVALELGSDVLSHFILTIDIPEKRLVLGLAEPTSAAASAAQ